MMIYSNIFLSVILLVATKGCGPSQQVQDMDMKQSEVLPMDTAYADVYRPLDGDWQGEFIIYEAIDGQRKGEVAGQLIDADFLQQLKLKEQSRISVKQKYWSLSPYFQKVEIEDTYVDNGQTKTIQSYGVNKIQHGVMWCVVQKPNEKIVHRGQTDGKATIIWSRKLQEPLHIEYFRETVLSDTYEIVGYGYYGNDDPNLTPKTWFHGIYRRI